VSASLIAALALAAGGCSIAEDPPSPSKRRPLKVAHAMGERRVPYRSERPATIDPAALEAALALGVRPVAASGARRDGTPPPHLGQLGGVELVGPPERVDVAALERIDPDVIIGNRRFQKRIFERLDRIAPTVMSGVALSEWKADLRFFGEALGRPDGAERLLIAYDERVARVRSALAGAEPDQLRVPRLLTRELSPGFAADVLSDVGLRRSEVAVSGRAGGIVSARRLLDALERSAGKAR
jgi:iron complex transport system substrate-binding protein